MTLDEVKDRGERIRLFFNKEMQLSLAHNRQTVEYLDGYINRNRHIFTDDKKYGWALAFGSILGEAIIRVFGGRWVQDDKLAEEWVIELTDGIGKANPIGKAYKQIENAFDSILSFFDIIGLAKAKGGFDRLGESTTSG